MAVILLLVAGCSTPAPESKPEYDELELKRYEICLETHMNYLRQNPKYRMVTTTEMIEGSERVCESLKPVKK